jgi:hypothetical protein
MEAYPTKPTALLVKALLTVLLLGQAAFAGQPKFPDIATIVSRVIDTYGGEKALRSVHGFHEAGNQWATQSELPIRAERWFARPDRLRLELAYPDHHETRITDGALGWTGDSIESAEPAKALKLQAMRLQTARLDLPLRLLEQQDAIEQRGMDPQGRAVLRIPIDTGLHIDYHVDLKTWLITRMTMGMTGPPSMEFAADYEQFRKVDGVLVPFKEITYAGDTATSTYQVIEFEWNPANLDDALKPGSRAFD